MGEACAFPVNGCASGRLHQFPENGIFHIMRKSSFSGKQFWGTEEPTLQRVLASVVDTLQSKLPDGWSVAAEPSVGIIPNRRLIRPDAELMIAAPDGREATIVVETKRRLDPALVPLVTEQLRRYQQMLDRPAGMVAAPFLSPRSRALLTQAGVNYADSTGNLRLALERPALYIETTGVASDPWTIPGDRPLRSLKGPTAGRVVRALCDFRPPYGVEQLAKRSGTSLGSVSRVFSFLEPEALIVREPRGPVTDVRWADLIQRWTTDYEFARSNTTRAYLEPRGLVAFLDKLRIADFPYAITGSLASAQIAPVASSRLATVYVEYIDQVAEVLRLRPAETAGNVVLAEPFDRVGFERTWEKDGITYAALSQVAADLLTGPGRGPVEGEALLRWMQENEDAWRS
jgi:hypothetical protein